MSHILIVEDETIIRSALRRLLERNQYQVSEAGSVQEARERYSIPGFDLVISDLRLREGRSGVDVLRAIARHYRQDLQRPGFARLLVTGETRPDRIGEIAASRIPVLFKPVSPQKLREAMLAAVFAARALPSEHSSSNP